MTDNPKDRVKSGIDDTELHIDKVVSNATGDAEKHAGGEDDQSIGRADEGIADAKDYAEDLAEDAKDNVDQ